MNATEFNAEYAQAIEHLMDAELDFRTIVINLAKRHPALFNQMVRGEVREPQAWHREVYKLCKANDPVNAIKLVRENTGFGLVESKKVVDFFCNAARNAGHTNFPSGDMPALEREQTKVVDMLIMALPTLNDSGDAHTF